MGRLRYEDNAITFLSIIFDWKGIPFLLSFSIEKWYPLKSLLPHFVYL